MIGRISGKVLSIDGNSVLVDVAGVGYMVNIIPGTLKNVHAGKELALWTHLASREDSLDLYGFMEKEELNFFKMLINISGIGPKSALGILSIAPPKILEKAVATENTSYLTKVSGIGRKNAEKIILELKDKFKLAGGDSEIKDDADVLLALKSLGYGREEAREAIKKLPEEISGTEVRIKEALKLLGK